MVCIFIFHCVTVQAKNRNHDLQIELTVVVVVFDNMIIIIIIIIIYCLLGAN